MTTIAMTSRLYHSVSHIGNICSSNTYHVTVECEDNGFDHIEVRGRRKRAHVTGVYELATDIEQYVHIDEDYFRDRKVVVIDDIYTTGHSSRAFIEAMEQAGATVVMAGFLAKTRQFGVR